MDAPYLLELCRMLVLIVLVVGASTKTLANSSFVDSLSSGFSVPTALARPAALAITGVEWLAAIALSLGGGLARAGAGLALALFVFFTAAIVQVLSTDRHVSCSCFGRSSHALSGIDLTRNSIYIAAASYVVIVGPVSMPVGGMAQLAIGLAATLCFLLSIGMNDVRNLLR